MCIAEQDAAAADIVAAVATLPYERHAAAEKVQAKQRRLHWEVFIWRISLAIIFSPLQFGFFTFVRLSKADGSREVAVNNLMMGIMVAIVAVEMMMTEILIAGTVDEFDKTWIN